MPEPERLALYEPQIRLVSRGEQVLMDKVENEVLMDKVENEAKVPPL